MITIYDITPLIERTAVEFDRLFEYEDVFGYDHEYTMTQREVACALCDMLVTITGQEWSFNEELVKMTPCTLPTKKQQ